jgi:pyrimidine-nucleoside phosphorylase
LTEDIRDALARKRDGGTVTEQELRSLVLGYARGEVADHVASAFLMAAFIQGLDVEETTFLTRALVDSGTTLALDGVSRPTVDKHSTGGVADAVTLVFAPLAASLGLGLAKLSGRGLGHTGGTLDKLESIPGFRTDLTPEALQRQVEEIGCAVAAQSRDLVPADGTLYALRDATATVPSVPLIAASVMSKKLAVETDLILLDVKAGSGAFMETPEDAEDLAGVCVRLATSWGRGCTAAVSDMSQPLGDAVGNALDIAEALTILRGEGHGRLRELTLLFAARAQQALMEASEAEAAKRAEEALASGAALESFRSMIEAQGGDPRVVDDPGSVLPTAPHVRPLLADAEGTVATMDAEAIGRASVMLGAGRLRKGDAIDPAVGIVLHAKIGDRLEPDQPIGEIHARDSATADAAATRVLAALSLSDEAIEPPPLVYGWHHG